MAPKKPKDRSGGRKGGDTRQCSRCPESFVLTDAQAKWGESRCRACRSADDHRTTFTTPHGTRNTYASGCRCAPCRTANAEYSRRHREKHPQWHSAWAKTRWKTEKMKARRREYELANKHKMDARDAVQRAIDAGRLVRPTACPNCGRTVRIEAHHADYSRPLDVEWLCRRCHAQHHERPTRTAESSARSAAQEHP